MKNELKKSETFDSIYFQGKGHFEEDGTQNYLVFQPMYRYFKRLVSIDNGNYWKSKGLSDERINSIAASSYKDYSTIKLLWYQNKSRI